MIQRTFSLEREQIVSKYFREVISGFEENFLSSHFEIHENAREYLILNETAYWATF